MLACSEVCGDFGNVHRVLSFLLGVEDVSPCATQILPVAGSLAEILVELYGILQFLDYSYSYI